MGRCATSVNSPYSPSLPRYSEPATKTDGLACRSAGIRHALAVRACLPLTVISKPLVSYCHTGVSCGSGWSPWSRRAGEPMRPEKRNRSVLIEARYETKSGNRTDRLGYALRGSNRERDRHSLELLPLRKLDVENLGLLVSESFAHRVNVANYASETVRLKRRGVIRAL